jgi:hypothetical protein
MDRQRRTRKSFPPVVKAARRGAVLVGGLLLGVATLASATPSRCPVVIGSITTFGPSVSVNNHPARSGSALCDGDRVATRANSSAFISLVTGGSIQLDEHTSAHVRRQDQRPTLRLLHGRTFVDADGARVETDTTTTVVRTGLHAHATLTHSAVTAVSGDAEVSRPARVQLHQAHELTTSRSGVTTRRLSPQALASLTSWRSRYFSRASSPPPALPGIAGGARPSPSFTQSPSGGPAESWQAPPTLMPAMPSGAASVTAASPTGGGGGLPPGVTPGGGTRVSAETPSVQSTPNGEPIIREGGINITKPGQFKGLGLATETYRLQPPAMSLPAAAGPVTQPLTPSGRAGAAGAADLTRPSTAVPGQFSSTVPRSVGSTNAAPGALSPTQGASGSTVIKNQLHNQLKGSR